MARSTREKQFDERRINESRKIEFLYFQYVRRRFLRDLYEKYIDIVEFNKHYFELFRALVRICYEKHAKINGIFLDTELMCTDEEIYTIHRNAPKIIFCIMNDIIAEYHESINDNPEFACNFFRKNYDIDMFNIIKENEKSVAYMRDICLRYGYFPDDISSMHDIIEDYIKLCMNSFTVPPSFIRIEKYSDIVRTHFISKRGKCYFEKHEKGVLYVYCDASSYINIDELIKNIKVRVSRKGKKNFSDEMRYSDAPNMQLCIDMNINFNDKSKKMNFYDEIRYALVCAINYYAPFNYSFSREIQDVQWRILQAKYKKISYLRRFVGLFIWDMVHIMEMKLSGIIALLIEMTKDRTFVPLQQSKLSENIVESVREMAELIDSEIADGMVLEAQSLDREYRLASQSIQTMSICNHVTGKLTRKSSAAITDMSFRDVGR